MSFMTCLVLVKVQPEKRGLVAILLDVLMPLMPFFLKAFLQSCPSSLCLPPLQPFSPPAFPPSRLPPLQLPPQAVSFPLKPPASPSSLLHLLLKDTSPHGIHNPCGYGPL